MNYPYAETDCQPCAPEESLRVREMTKTIDELRYQLNAIVAKVSAVADATFGPRPETKSPSLQAVGNAPSVHNSICELRDALAALSDQVERF